MNVALDPVMAEFVKEQVKSGRYQTPEDVVGGALAALESQQEEVGADELRELKAQIAVGLEQAERGEVEDWDIDELRAEGRRLMAEAERLKTAGLDDNKAI